MKRLFTIALVLAAAAAYGQKTPQTLGGKNTEIIAQSDLRVDSLLFLPLTDTVRRPLRAGGVVFRDADKTLYWWTGAQWKKFDGSGGDSLYKRADSLFASRGGAERFVARIYSHYTVPTGLGVTLSGDTVKITSLLSGLVAGKGGGFINPVIVYPLYYSGDSLKMHRASVSRSGYLDSTDFLTFSNKVDNTRQILTQYSLTGGGNLSQDRTLMLAGDVAIPGPRKYYGTNADGVRGWWNVTSAIDSIKLQMPFGFSAAPTLYSGGTITVATSLQGIVRANGGGFDTVTVQAPLLFQGGVLSLRQADSLTDGYVTAGDWSRFDKKVPPTRRVNTVHSLAGGGSLTEDVTLSLVNDVTTPGARMLYGTDESGIKRWLPIPYDSTQETESDPVFRAHDLYPVDSADILFWDDHYTRAQSDARYLDTAFRATDSTLRFRRPNGVVWDIPLGRNTHADTFAVVRFAQVADSSYLAAIHNNGDTSKIYFDGFGGGAATSFEQLADTAYEAVRSDGAATVFVYEVEGSLSGSGGRTYYAGYGLTMPNDSTFAVDEAFLNSKLDSLYLITPNFFNQNLTASNHRYHSMSEHDLTIDSIRSLRLYTTDALARMDMDSGYFNFEATATRADGTYLYGWNAINHNGLGVYGSSADFGLQMTKDGVFYQTMIYMEPKFIEIHGNGNFFGIDSSGNIFMHDLKDTTGLTKALYWDEATGKVYWQNGSAGGDTSYTEGYGIDITGSTVAADTSVLQPKLTFSNGLTRVGNTAVLGGTLTGDTRINLNGYQFRLSNNYGDFIMGNEDIFMSYSGPNTYAEWFIDSLKMRSYVYDYTTYNQSTITNSQNFIELYQHDGAFGNGWVSVNEPNNRWIKIFTHKDFNSGDITNDELTGFSMSGGNMYMGWKKGVATHDFSDFEGIKIDSTRSVYITGITPTGNSADSVFVKSTNGKMKVVAQSSLNGGGGSSPVPTSGLSAGDYIKWTGSGYIKHTPPSVSLSVTGTTTKTLTFTRMDSVQASATFTDIAPSTTDNNLSVSGSGAISVKKVWNTIPWSTTITVDAAISMNHSVTLAGATTINFSNGQDGDILLLELVQDATGSRTVTWGSDVDWSWTSSGTAPTLKTTGGARNAITLTYKSSTGKWHGMY